MKRSVENQSEILEQIRTAIAEKGIKQVQLAKEIGVTFQHLNNVLHGRYNLTDKVGDELLTALGLRVPQAKQGGASIEGYMELNGQIYKISGLRDFNAFIRNVNETLGCVTEDLKHTKKRKTQKNS